MIKQNWKFSQSVFLATLPPGHALKGGVCNTLSYDWIRNQLAGTPVDYSVRSIIKGPLVSYEVPDQSIPQHIMSLFRGVNSFLSTGKTVPEAMRQIAQGDGLTTEVSSYKLLVAVGGSLWDEIQKHQTKFNKSFLHVSFFDDGKKMGHAIAIKLTSPYLLFDPNYGEYSCSILADLQQLFVELIDKFYPSLGLEGDLISYSGTPRSQPQPKAIAKELRLASAFAIPGVHSQTAQILATFATAVYVPYEESISTATLNTWVNQTALAVLGGRNYGPDVKRIGHQFAQNYIIKHIIFANTGWIKDSSSYFGLILVKPSQFDQVFALMTGS